MWIRRDLLHVRLVDLDLDPVIELSDDFGVQELLPVPVAVLRQVSLQLSTAGRGGRYVGEVLDANGLVLDRRFNLDSRSGAFAVALVLAAGYARASVVRTRCEDGSDVEEVTLGVEPTNG